METGMSDKKAGRGNGKSQTRDYARVRARHAIAASACMRRIRDAVKVRSKGGRVEPVRGRLSWAGKSL